MDTPVLYAMCSLTGYIKAVEQRKMFIPDNCSLCHFYCYWLEEVLGSLRKCLVEPRILAIPTYFFLALRTANKREAGP